MLKQKLGIIGIIGTSLPLLLLTGNSAAANFQNGSFEEGIDILDIRENLIQNGSFETGTNPGTLITLSKDSTAAIDNWKVTDGNINYVGTAWNAADGQRSVDLNGDQAGAIAQTFNTTVGQQYRVNFKLAGNPEKPQGEKKIRVSAGGQSADFTFDTTGKRHRAMGWETIRYLSFTANTSETTLKFESLTKDSPVGPALDRVEVNLYNPPQACVPGDTGDGRSFTYNLTYPSLLGGMNSVSLVNPSFPGTLRAIKNSFLLEGILNIDSTGSGVAGVPASGNVGKDNNNQEALRITIPAVDGVSPAYRLVSATYANVLSSSTQFGITVDNKSCTFNVENPGLGTIEVSNPTGSLAGTNFDFFVVDKGGQFRLQSATFETVPEPLTILGTGFAAAALPALKRVHKKAKK